jgi:lipid A disaccharide synthetase
LLIHVPYIAMSNLILGAEVFPEFIQGRARADFMTPRAQEWLERPEELEAVRNKVHALPGLMERKGAVAGTASVIRDLALESSKQKEEQWPLHSE